MQNSKLAEAYTQINNKGISVYKSGNIRNDYFKIRTRNYYQLILKIYFSREDQKQLLDYFDKIFVSKISMNLKSFIKNQIITERKQLHSTFLQIIVSTDETKFETADYDLVLKDFFKSLKPFKIKIKGISFAPDTILLKGFPEIDLKLHRMQLRDILNQHNLLMKERYQIKTSHISIVRFLTTITKNELTELLDASSNKSILNPQEFIICTAKQITLEESNYVDRTRHQSILSKYTL